MSRIPPEDLRFGQVVWDYLRVDEKPFRSEIILVMGSPDLNVARHAATLMKAGLAPRVFVSGGQPIAGEGSETEAEAFGKEIAGLGVPPEVITQEPAAQHTSGNFWLTEQLLGRLPDSAILCCSPMAERRALATGRLRWPGTVLSVGGLHCGFNYYLSKARDPGQVLSWMVGEIERITEYPLKGFMSAPDVLPSDAVLKAFRHLRPVYDGRPLPMRRRQPSLVS